MLRSATVPRSGATSDIHGSDDAGSFGNDVTDGASSEDEECESLQRFSLSSAKPGKAPSPSLLRDVLDISDILADGAAAMVDDSFLRWVLPRGGAGGPSWDFCCCAWCMAEMAHGSHQAVRGLMYLLHDAGQ